MRVYVEITFEYIGFLIFQSVVFRDLGINKLSLHTLQKTNKQNSLNSN